MRQTGPNKPNSNNDHKKVNSRLRNLVKRCYLCGEPGHRICDMARGKSLRKSMLKYSSINKRSQRTWWKRNTAWQIDPLHLIAITRRLTPSTPKQPKATKRGCPSFSMVLIDPGTSVNVLPTHVYHKIKSTGSLLYPPLTHLENVLQRNSWLLTTIASQSLRETIPFTGISYWTTFQANREYAVSYLVKKIPQSKARTIPRPLPPKPKCPRAHQQHSV